MPQATRSRSVRAATLVVVFLISACDDYLWRAPAGGGIGDATGWCAVQQIVATSCASCHNSAAPAGELDLSTDPHAALVGVPSSPCARTAMRPS